MGRHVKGDVRRVKALLASLWKGYSPSPWLLGAELALTWDTPARALPVGVVAGIISASATSFAAIAVTAVINIGLSIAFSALVNAVVGSKTSSQDRQASVTTLAIGESPRIVIFGEPAVGGSLVDTFNWGGTYGTDWECMMVALADHKCDSLVSFYVNDQLITFPSGGFSDGYVPDVSGGPAYNGQLRVWFLDGSANQTLPDVCANGGWGLTGALGGVCTAVVAYKADDPSATNPVWAGGRPSFLWVVKGKHCYDPRKDGSVGGSGVHPWTDPSTWEWTDNPIICRYNWVRGIYAKDQVADPTQLLLGRGLSSLEAPEANIFAAANICDEEIALSGGGSEKTYRIGGVIKASDLFVDTEKMFADAVGGVIIQPGGSIEVEPGHARGVTAYFTDDDLIVGSSVKVSKYRSEADNAWVNTVVPRYSEPAQKYQEHAAPIARVDADVVADGGPRVMTLTLDQVISGTQAQRLGEVQRRLGRLGITASVALGPRFMGIEEGDWISWTSARHFGGQEVIFRVEAYSIDEKRQISITLRQIEADVFNWSISAEQFDQAIVNPQSKSSDYLKPYDGLYAAQNPKYSDGTSINDLRPSAPGATNGADPNSPIGNAGMTIGQFLTLEAQARSDIASLGVVTSGLQLGAAALESRIYAAEGTISTQTSQIAANGSSITEAWTAIDSIEGQLATLDVGVSAGSQLLTNGGLERGDLTDWSQGGDGIGLWSVDADGYGAFGPVAFINNPPTTAFDRIYYCYRDFTSGGMASGNMVGAPFTLSCDAQIGLNAGPQAYFYLQLDWFDASGNVIDRDYTPAGNRPLSNLAFDPSDLKRRDTKVTGLVRSGAVKVRSYVAFHVPANSVVSTLGWRRAKLERGTEATQFSAEAAVHETFKAISSTDLQVATLSTSVSTIGSTVTTQASAISSLQSNYASLSSTVSTQGASITSNASAISALQSDLATLEITVGTQGAQVSGLASALSTQSLQFAQLVTKVSTQGPNLCVNGGFENGLAGWTIFSGNVGTGAVDGSGPIIYGINVGLNAMIGTPIKVSPTTNYTIAIDPYATDAGSYAYCDFYFLDAAMSAISGSDSVSHPLYGPRGFDGTDAARIAGASTAVSPSNAAWLVPRVGMYIDAPGQSARGRRVKVQEGATVSPYSAEASVQLAFASVNGAFARAALTLDVNGYVTGWETNNNGQTGDMTVLADSFSVVKPGGGARTTYANGAWKVFDASGTLRVQIGNLDA